MRVLRRLFASAAGLLLAACVANPTGVEVEPVFAIRDAPECIHVTPQDGVSFECGDDNPEEEGTPPSVYVEGESVSEPH